ncbi:MAG: efflux RND transporter periplasmic adaptor subunit [Spirochaetota bacterium]
MAEKPTGKHTTPIVGGARVRRAGSRRQGVLALFAVAAIALLAFAGYLLFVPREDEVVLSDYATARVTVQTLQDTLELGGTVAARRTAAVTAPEQGVLESLLVAEGDWVAEGAPLAVIDAETLRDTQRSTERALERELRDYDRLLLEHRYRLAALERTGERLQEQVADATDDLAETRELVEIGSATGSEQESAEERLDDARQSLEDHLASVEETIALHELARANAEADIAELREELDDLDERLAETRIEAPISGRVVSVADAASATGTVINQFATILTLADTRDPLIESAIEEQYVGDIESGRPVAVEVGGERLLGTIERIGQVASAADDGGTPTVEIDIALDTELELIPGSSALVEVLLGEIAGALVLPRGPFLTSGNRRYVYRVEGDAAFRTEVEYGAITDDRVQIVAGLSEGDHVITSSYQSFIDVTTVTLGGTE